MPNHVHALIAPLGEYKISDILHLWKSFTANEINKHENRNGHLWMRESYDHIVRNENSLKSIRHTTIKTQQRQELLFQKLLMYLELPAPV